MQASHSRTMLGWMRALSERDSVPLSDLARLPTVEICRRIAHLQFRIAADEARMAYARPPGRDRNDHLEKLSAGHLLDRIAADLVRRWDREKV